LTWLPPGKAWGWLLSFEGHLGLMPYLYSLLSYWISGFPEGSPPPEEDA